MGQIQSWRELNCCPGWGELEHLAETVQPESVTQDRLSTELLSVEGLG